MFKRIFYANPAFEIYFVLNDSLPVIILLLSCIYVRYLGQVSRSGMVTYRIRHIEIHDNKARSTPIQTAPGASDWLLS